MLFGKLRQPRLFAEIARLCPANEPMIVDGFNLGETRQRFNVFQCYPDLQALT